MNLNTVYMAYDYQKTNQNIMADSYVQDELTRLRLKLVEQVSRDFVTRFWGMWNETFNNSFHCS